MLLIRDAVSGAAVNGAATYRCKNDMLNSNSKSINRNLFYFRLALQPFRSLFVYNPVLTFLPISFSRFMLYYYPKSVMIFAKALVFLR
jgi:hypothetical protein